MSLRMDLGKYKGQATRSQALVEELTATLKHAEARAARCEELSGQVESLQSELNSSTLLNAEKRLVMEELRAQIGAVKAKAERRAELAIAKVRVHVCACVRVRGAADLGLPTTPLRQPCDRCVAHAATPHARMRVTHSPSHLCVRRRHRRRTRRRLRGRSWRQ